MKAHPDVTRVEVIDHRHPYGTILPAVRFRADQRFQGEVPFEVSLSWQDDGRTLKIFLADRPRPKEKT